MFIISSYCYFVKKIGYYNFIVEKYLFIFRISDIISNIFSLCNKDMHKLVLIFLLGILVILLSFGTNMNIISKAMALNIVPLMDKNGIVKYHIYYF
jgi:hypothetical protein